MSNPIEEIMINHKEELEYYASDFCKEAEEDLIKNGVRICEATIDDRQGARITIDSWDDFIGYLKTHNVAEVFKTTELFCIFEAQIDFLDKIKSFSIIDDYCLPQNIPISGICFADIQFEADIVEKSFVEKAYLVFTQYLATVMRNAPCIEKSASYVVGSQPYLIYLAETEMDEIEDVKKELLRYLIQCVVEKREAENNREKQHLWEIVEKAKEELDLAHEFLLADPEFQKCTNLKLRMSYMNRNVIFDNGRFPNLYIALNNCRDTVRSLERIEPEEGGKLDTEFRNLICNHQSLYELTWKEIKER